MVKRSCREGILNSHREPIRTSQFPPRMNLGRENESANSFSVILLLSLIWNSKISNAVDKLSQTDSIKDGETIISSDGNFEMGFFSPGSSNYRYVGIWYKKISEKTVVWVANRETPLKDASGVLKVMNQGILVLVNASDSVIWSTNTTRTVQNPVAQLLDSGNLVVKDANENDDTPENFLWQSFDNPTDTLLPEMKLGKNFETGREVYLSSWKSNDDPAPGDLTYHLDSSGYPQKIIRRGSLVQYRAGPWNGLHSSGSLNSKENPIYTFDFVFDKKEVYFSYHLLSSAVSRFVLNQSGIAQRWTWINRTKNWVLYFSVPNDNCDSYKLCGPYGICRIRDSPICSCLDRFEPKYPSNWALADWSSGCVRRTPLDCKIGGGFLKYSGVKLPDTRNSWYNGSMSLEECRAMCLKNCSCMAYANSDIRNGGNGCLLWFDELLDIREVPKGQDLYIRMASSEIASTKGSNQKKRKILALGLSLVTGTFLFGLILTVYILKWEKYQKKNERGRKKDVYKEYNEEELPLFDFATIAKATREFSLENKLGEGGFGSVYKGVLEEGREIAVKRLSKSSTQGLDEFKNEVICTAKLQHRNLVRLLGCCIQEQEEMLVYEFMNNRSLDSFLFDPRRSRLLDWPTRFHIINGIARGLVYLHQDSRLRIIHRDLKASNVLLDNEMNPKISDFGLARIFRGNETGDKTSRVIGTYGYMSPEYAVHGHFSVKSDVFSFGVTVLEIVSGERNTKFIHRDHHHNLLGHAWLLYKEGRSVELVDANLCNSFDLSQVLRSIHVGLLCVQQCVMDRPDMSSVILMLSNDGILPEAKQPGFFMEVITRAKVECSSSFDFAGSTNDVTISSTMFPR